VLIKTKNQVGKILEKMATAFPFTKQKSPASLLEKQGFR